jgi:steroid 5-alpha reductase family enzyme
METWVLPLVGWLVLAIAMAAAWAAQRRSQNAGIVDVLWTAGLGVLAVAYAALADGWGPRRLLVAVLVGFWSLRLTAYLVRRVSTEAEDGRYRELREELGDRFQTWIFWFFQAQALLDVLLSLVFLYLVSIDHVGWRAFDVAGVAVWLVALVGESISDRQLAQWRTNPANRGLTCRAGLWRYSRHPNYFFEWLHWIAYALIGAGLPGAWLLWLAPATMLFLVLKVTGIPPTERQAVRSRGDDYRRYQKTTNAFFPGPVRDLPEGVESGVTS